VTLTPRIFRQRLVHTPAIRVEWLRCAGLSREPTAELYEPETQVVVTLAGAFVYHVGRQRRFVDANCLAFVRAGETSRDSHPERGDVDCLVLTPAAEHVDGARLPQTVLAGARLQIAAARLVETTLRARVPVDPLVIEEEALALAHQALVHGGAARAPQPSGAVRLAERAKALLSPAGPPIALTALARRLSVSPAYLTDAFRRAQGLPIVRYQLRLRLARALAELPRRDDLTALALDLGFSSHSHFSTAFRATMGLTPSEYRRQTRDAIQRSRKRGRAQRRSVGPCD
jgi:AraC family transcriptional regulator